MRRTLAALALTALSLVAAGPVGAAETSTDDGYVCVKSTLLFGEGDAYCIDYR